jgi:hypothetical protein
LESNGLELEQRDRESRKAQELGDGNGRMGRKVRRELIIKGTGDWRETKKGCYLSILNSPSLAFSSQACIICVVCLTVSSCTS